MAHARRQFSTVDGPPLPRGTMWSISRRKVEPQMPPESMGHVHLPSSRAQTARFTAAVRWPGFFAGRGFFCGRFTAARRVACWASRRSSAASMTFSAEAPGWA